MWNNISDLASNVILGQMENEIKNQADKAGKEMANLIEKNKKNVDILLKQVGLKKKTPMDWVKDKMKGNNKIRK
ncbi:MAG: hypothetical protein KH296_05350 [Ruminococcus sp.]|nr:hypothetical protein [Ruminococcus sp.]